MIAKDILRIILYGVGLASLSALVYMAGPFIAFGDYHPLENFIVREIVILLLISAVAAFTGEKIRHKTIVRESRRVRRRIKSGKECFVI